MRTNHTTGTRWATFDCYGTLVDWEQGMLDALTAIVPKQASGLLAQYYPLEPEVEAEQPFHPYRYVLEETLRRAAARKEIDLPPGSERILVETLPRWPVFTDVGPALLALQAEGWKLAILSNVDRDLITQTLRALPVSFDAVVTAEDVGAYKPALNHFHHFLDMSKVEPEDWVHVARSHFHDIAPAATLGIKRVWINREGGPEPSPLSTVILPNLIQLPESLQQLMGIPEKSRHDQGTSTSL